jgi:transposase
VTKDTMIGVDLAKNVFQLHGASMTGQMQFRKKLSRQGFYKFMAEQPPAVVVMEACGSAHYWAREMIRLGHDVKLIAPHYVRPFVKRQKNDAADAEAIVIGRRCALWSQSLLSSKAGQFCFGLVNGSSTSAPNS